MIFCSKDTYIIFFIPWTIGNIKVIIRDSERNVRRYFLFRNAVYFGSSLFSSHGEHLTFAHLWAGMALGRALSCRHAVYACACTSAHSQHAWHDVSDSAAWRTRWTRELSRLSPKFDMLIHATRWPWKLIRLHAPNNVTYRHAVSSCLWKVNDCANNALWLQYGLGSVWKQWI